ncbi:hypothetical protein [Ahniella affigens]|nr:hypothetical protein [Ahniella affigens]
MVELLFALILAGAQSGIIGDEVPPPPPPPPPTEGTDCCPGEGGLWD